MTAITLNLLSEEQIAQEANARDPLRASIGIGAAILSVMVLCGSLFSVFASQKKTELSLLQKKWETVQANQLKADSKDWQGVRGAAEDILEINRQRVRCAPQLALIKDLIPDSVQLSRLGLTITTEVLPGSDAPAIKESDGKKSVRPRASRNVERMTLRMEGRAVSRRPEIEVDAFLQSLRSDPVFKANVEQIQLRSIARSPVKSEGETLSVPSVNFVVECPYKERK